MLIAITELPPKVSQWFVWPYNFDPVWGPDECVGFAEKKDPGKVRTFSAEEELMVLLGKRGSR